MKREFSDRIPSFGATDRALKQIFRPTIQKAETAIFYEMNRSTLGMGDIAAWTVVRQTFAIVD